MEFISAREAADLLEEVDHFSDLQLSEHFDREFKELTARIQVANAPGYRDRALDSGEFFWEILHESAERASEHTYWIWHQESDWSTSMFRVRPNRVFKLGEASRLTVLGALRIAMLAVVSPLRLLAVTQLVGEVLDLARALVKCYEKIDDLLERRVFEATWELQNTMAVVNYDALEASDYDRAYGVISPTVEEIAVAVGGNEEEILGALADMKQRSIVDERGGRWSVRFW